jgi:hypothetical protein
MNRKSNLAEVVALTSVNPDVNFQIEQLKAKNKELQEKFEGLQHQHLELRNKYRHLPDLAPGWCFAFRSF